MHKVYIAKQKILDRESRTFAHELLFRDSANGINKFPTNIKATSHVIINTLTNINTDDLIGKQGIAFINIDESVLTSEILDILDKDRFILEILETTKLTDKVISKIKQYHSRGFRIALDDFDCSSEMIIKFNPLFKYIDTVKIDVQASEPENLINVFNKLKKTNIKLLAEKIETKEEYDKYLDMGFDYFQGYYLHKPKNLELNRYKESTQLVILNLIKIIKDDASTTAIESYLKMQADLSYKLLKFLNNLDQVKVKVKSITQIITLLGRARLLRWLMIYLYSEISTNPAAKSILDMAIKRAEQMSADVDPIDKDRAYLAGMFSMLDSIFESDIEDIMEHINVDEDITALVVHKKGKFAPSLRKVEKMETDHLKNILVKNIDKISQTDIISILKSNGIEIESA